MHGKTGKNTNHTEENKMTEEILEEEKKAVQIDNEGNITIILPV